MPTPTSYSTEEARAILNQAIDKWGEDPQLTMVMEECAELIQAISKLMRNKEGAVAHLLEEMADVQIMLEQLTSILERRGTTDAQARIEGEGQRKLRRTVERLAQ